MIRPTGAASFLTSIVLNGFLLVILDRNVAGGHLHTASNFPTPFDHNFAHRCGAGYLGVPFICDPDGLLSKTEADHISDSYFIGDRSFRSCVFNRNCQIFNYRRSSVPADRQPTVGIGLASRLFHTDFCRHKSPSATGAILADSIRSRWSTSDCEVDVFLLCSVSLHCPNRSSIDHTAPLRHLVRRRPTDPLLFLSLNDRLRRGIGPADWLAVEKLSSRPAAHCADRISGALRLLQKLLPMAAKVEPSRINPDRSPRGHQRYGELLPPHRQHTIPGWAILVFAGCALLTCLCFLLGHLINRASSLKKRRSLASEAASVALHKKHDRRWGAGFGGGLIEIQNKSQTGAGGQVGGRGASKKQASLFKGFTQASHKHTGSNRAANPWSRI